jgi:hypothetical protein
MSDKEHIFDVPFYTTNWFWVGTLHFINPLAKLNKLSRGRAAVWCIAAACLLGLVIYGPVVTFTILGICFINLMALYRMLIGEYSKESVWWADHIVQLITEDGIIWVILDGDMKPAASARYHKTAVELAYAIHQSHPFLRRIFSGDLL